MKKSSVIIAIAALLIILVVGSAGASDARSPAGAPLLASTGTGFTYQGYLEDLGSPANGAYDLEVKLYDILSGGSPIGTVVKDDVSVSGGYFTVTLDFGSVFDGTAFWLEIGVRPGASTGSYTSLTPRQPLTAVPYALTALNLPPHDHFGESWTGLGTGLSLASTDTTGFVNGLWAESASDEGNGIYGYATSTTGPAWGVVGESDADEGIGIFGRANATSGVTYGVWGETSSASDYATGVYGLASGTTGFTSGATGVTNSTAGIGVVGFTSATSGDTIGVYGQSDSTAGVGVWGYASSNSTAYVPVGVYGQNSSSTGWGVYASGDLGASGNLYVYGGTKSAVVETLDYGWRELYAMESPGVWFEDFGSDTLSAGERTIFFEQIFAQTVNFGEDYHVFLTPLGDCGLYVSEKTGQGFTVRAFGGSTCEIGFDYRIVAKRMGFESTRLETANTPLEPDLKSESMIHIQNLEFSPGIEKLK